MNVNAYLIPRSNVQISRSFTKVVLDESIVDLETLEDADGEEMTIDEIIEKQSKRNEYDSGSQYGRDSTTSEISIDGEISSSDY